MPLYTLCWFTGSLFWACGFLFPDSIVVKAFIYYCVCIQILFGTLFYFQTGEFLVGKDSDTGEVPWWSYLLFSSFHLQTHFSLFLSTLTRPKLSPANQIAEDVYIGGAFSHSLDKTWGAVVDLTVEHSEKCPTTSGKDYLNVPVWDGNPPSVQQLDDICDFLISKSGPKLIHCAFGVGRSTTAACAYLVKSGISEDWKSAFSLIKKQRTIVRLNKRMKASLQAWQDAHFAKCR